MCRGGGLRGRWGDSRPQLRIPIGRHDTCAPLSTSNPLPAAHHPHLTHPYLTSPTAIALLPQNWEHQERLARSGEAPGDWQNPDSSASLGDKDQNLDRAQGSAEGRNLQEGFIWSLNLTRLLPALSHSPHHLHGPHLNYPGYPASPDPWKQVSASPLLAAPLPGTKSTTGIHVAKFFLFGPGFWCRKMSP